MTCVLQYYLGSSKWVDVAGGGAARSVAECGFPPGTWKDLFLRAVNAHGIGEKASLDAISTGEFHTYSTNKFALIKFVCEVPVQGN